MTKRKKLLEIRPVPGSSLVPKTPKSLMRTEPAEWKKTTYKPGDGDHTVYIPRPGSCHKHILSRGNST